MKKPSKPKTDDDLRPHYDFSKGVRGKHFERYWEGKGVVLLEPDIAKVFKNSAAVNAALRGLYCGRAKLGSPGRCERWQSSTR